MGQINYHLKSRILIMSLLLLTLFGPAVSAQPTATVVILASHNSDAYQQLSTFFTAHLHNSYPAMEIAPYLLTDDTPKNDAALAEIRTLRPDLILALGSHAIRSGLTTLPDTPLIASMVIDAESFRLSNHATGVLLQIPASIHFQWLQRFLPAAHNIGVLYDPHENRAWVKAAEHAAQLSGLKLIAIAVESPQELPQALKTLSRSAEVLVGIPDTTVYSRNTAKMVLLSTFRNRIPFVGLSQSWVKAGALYGLEWDYGEIGRQCSAIALEILTGTPPKKIPPQLPTTQARYSINMKTAHHMNLDIDATLLAGASATYE